MWQAINVLFVCARNKLRSPTAERVFYGTHGINVRSAGTARDAENQISQDDIEFADLIFVMEKRHGTIIKQNYPDLIKDRSIITLNISDDYQYMDSELIEILESRLAEYLDLDDLISVSWCVRLAP